MRLWDGGGGQRLGVRELGGLNFLPSTATHDREMGFMTPNTIMYTQRRIVFSTQFRSVLYRVCTLKHYIRFI